MSCLISNGVALPCFSVGGTEKVYLGTYSASQVYAINPTTQVITGITSGQTIYLFEAEPESTSLTQKKTNNRDNGTGGVVSTLTIKLNNLDYALRNTAIALSKAPLFAVVKSNSGEYVILGVESPGRAIETDFGFGAKFDDANQVMLNVEFRSKEGMYWLNSTLVGTSLPIG